MTAARHPIPFRFRVAPLTIGRSGIIIGIARIVRSIAKCSLIVRKRGARVEPQHRDLAQIVLGCRRACDIVLFFVGELPQDEFCFVELPLPNQLVRLLCLYAVVPAFRESRRELAKPPRPVICLLPQIIIEVIEIADRSA